MKVLAITGNPKRKGALAQLTDEAVRGARERGAEVEEIRLAEMDINYCRFCLTCRGDADSPIARCAQSDDMAGLLEKIYGADGYIFACPTSAGRANAIMKTFLERMAWTLGRPTKDFLFGLVSGCPESRLDDRPRYAVIITTTGVVPGYLRIACDGAREMRETARQLLKARLVGNIYGANVINRGGLKPGYLARAYEAGSKIPLEYLKKTNRA